MFFTPPSSPDTVRRNEITKRVNGTLAPAKPNTIFAEQRAELVKKSVEKQMNPVIPMDLTDNFDHMTIS